MVSPSALVSRLVSKYAMGVKVIPHDLRISQGAESKTSQPNKEEAGNGESGRVDKTDERNYASEGVQCYGSFQQSR